MIPSSLLFRYDRFLDHRVVAGIPQHSSPFASSIQQERSTIIELVALSPLTMCHVRLMNIVLLPGPVSELSPWESRIFRREISRFQFSNTTVHEICLKFSLHVALKKVLSVNIYNNISRIYQSVWLSSIRNGLAKFVLKLSESDWENFLNVNCLSNVFRHSLTPQYERALPQTSQFS